MTLPEEERTCTACGAVDPEGGLRLGHGEGAEYEWFCRLTRQCIARCAENVRRERLQVNPDPVAVVNVGRCTGCGKRAPWCSCGKADYR